MQNKSIEFHKCLCFRLILLKPNINSGNTYNCKDDSSISKINRYMIENLAEIELIIKKKLNYNNN